MQLEIDNNGIMLEYQADIKINDFRKQIMTVGEIVEIMQNRIDDNHSFLARGWSREQNSRCVESLLIGLPQPPLYVDNNDDDWYIFDGAERVKAYSDFISGKFFLSSLYFKSSQYEGKTYDDLSFLAKRNLLNTEIQVNVLNPGLSKEDRFGIYMCVKSRIDADSLRACRKKIYSKNYLLIENFARQILNDGTMMNLRRTSTIENEICHLLVASTYKAYLDKEFKYNIDLVSNMILDDNNFESFWKQVENKIYTTYSVSSSTRATLLFPRKRDYFNAVIFHLGLDNITESMFQEAYRQLEASARETQTVDVFCRNIDLLIEIIRGRYAR